MGTDLCHLESPEVAVPDHRLLTAAPFGVTAREGTACTSVVRNPEEPSFVSPGTVSVAVRKLKRKTNGNFA